MNNDILIIILDDNEEDGELLVRLLDKNGFSNNKLFKVSMTLLENIKRIPNARIFIIDYRIDALNGLEVIERIRKIMPHCYFIMLSGMKDYKVVEDFNNVGLRGKYVTKGEADTDNKIIKFIKEFIEDMQVMEKYYKSKDEIVNSIKDIRKIMKGDK
jgi:FixJ family two-component response regulator